MNRHRTRTLAPWIAVAAAVMCPAAAAGGGQSEPSKKGPDPTEVSKRQAFSVVLLLGDLQGGEFLDGVPTAARKALVDTKDFLPYKNYRLLDSQWTLCCSGPTSAITRLRGVDDQEYELELRAAPVFSSANPPAFEPGALSIRFLLREFVDPYAGMPKGEGDRREATGKEAALIAAEQRTRIAQLQNELFTLERERVDLDGQATGLRKRVEVGTKDPIELKRVEDQLALVSRRITTLKAELNAAQQSGFQGKQASGTKAVIDTSFRMDVGETVVVGTSGLRGGSKALIALLTAVSKAPKSR